MSNKSIWAWGPTGGAEGEASVSGQRGFDEEGPTRACKELPGRGAHNSSQQHDASGQGGGASCTFLCPASTGGPG